MYFDPLSTHRDHHSAPDHDANPPNFSWAIIASAGLWALIVFLLSRVV